jgi:hypothetical protein
MYSKMAISAFRLAKDGRSSDWPDLLPMGADPMRGSVETLLGSMHRQGLTKRLLGFDDVFGLGYSFLV